MMRKKRANVLNLLDLGFSGLSGYRLLFLNHEEFTGYGLVAGENALLLLILTR